MKKLSRVVKFRGENCDGSWVTGDLQQLQTKKFRTIIWNNVDHISYVVDPATVGQFTGLLDKNNEEIYEGHILKLGEINDNKDFVGKIGKVLFNNDNGSFVVEWKWSKNQHDVQLTCDVACDSVIVGNFCENPKMLG